MAAEKIKGVLFDMDGTLLDTSEGVFNSFNWALEKLGLPEVSEADKRSIIGPPLQDSFIRLYGMDKEHSQYACDVYRQYYRTRGVYEAAVYDGVKELCLKLKAKGIKTGVATNKVEHFAVDVLKHFGIADCFDTVHGSMEIHNTLTKTDIILSCVKDLGLDGGEVLLIGDSEFDAIGANEAGVGFIGVTYGFGFENIEDVNEYSPIFACEQVEELLEFFNL